MSDINSVARNFFALGSGEVVSRVIAFGVTIYLARILGAEGYGMIAFAVGITVYLSKIADFAIEVIGTKEIAEAPTSVNHLASAVMSIRLLLAALLTVFAILGSFFSLTGSERTLLMLYFLTLIPIAANTKWIHLGLENAKPIGFSRVVSESLTLAIVLIFIRNMNDLWIAPVASIVGESCLAFLLILALRRERYRFGLRWDPSTALPIFKKALPLLGQTMLWLIIYNSDLIFLRLLRDNKSVGYYAAAYMLICFIANVGFLYGMSLLPTLTRLGAGSESEKKLYQTAIAHVYAVCLPLSIGGCLLAPQIITIGFGENYTDSISILQILIWCIPFSLLRTVPWAGLIARGRQTLLLKAMFYSAIVNILLNSLFIPRYGIFGAAIATVITECFSGVIIFKYAALHNLPFVSFRRFWRPTVANIFMLVSLVIFGYWSSNLFASLTLGVLSYLLVLTALGVIRFHIGKLPVLHI